MTNKKNAQWLNNRNATKNPKMFNMTFRRDESGDFHAVVNTRDLTRVLNSTGVKAS